MKTSSEYHSLLKPEIVNSISGLQLLSRIVVEGYLSGYHKSRRVGHGQEFSQYRGYEPGDDLRLLDWKMLARSGRHYIKQSDTDTNVNTKFILDLSRSMAYEEGGLSKLDFVKVLVASLTYLAEKQGDALGMYAVNNQKMEVLHPAISRQQFNKILYHLVHMEAAGSWPLDSHRMQALHDGRKKELIFFISDLYENQQELVKMISSLKTPKNEVIVLQVLGRSEVDFDYQGSWIFEDLESGQRYKLNASEAKAHYQQAFNSYQRELKDTFLQSGIGYFEISMNEPLNEVLQGFLKQRNRLL